MERACKNCDYYDAKPTGHSEWGVCKRHAPTVLKDGAEPTWWPRIHNTNDWCGEMAPKGTWNKMQRLVERMEREALDLACLSDEIEV